MAKSGMGVSDVEFEIEKIVVWESIKCSRGVEWT